MSRALPPLCEPPLRQEVAPDEGIDERVRQSIERVLSRQDSAGSFGLWSPGGGDLWLDAFATDFSPVPANADSASCRKRRSVPRPAAQLPRQHERRECPGERDRLCGLCARPQRALRHGRSALPRRHPDRLLQDTPRAGPDRGGARFSAIEAGRRRPRGGRPAPAGHPRRRRLPPDYGSRLRDGAGLLALAGDERGPRCDPADQPGRRGRALAGPPDEHAGERLDGARRAGAAQRRQRDHPRRRRCRAEGRLLPHLQGCGAGAETRHDRQPRRGGSPGGAQRHRQPDRTRAGHLPGLHGRAQLLQARRRPRTSSRCARTSASRPC